MAAKHVHYEAAFEDFIRAQGWPYVAVCEQRRALFGADRVKSFDFVVYRAQRGEAARSKGWLVDVKGRKFPYESIHGPRYWENWVTAEDVTDLTRWEQEFGEGFEAMFVFAYLLSGPPQHWPDAPTHEFRGRTYAFLYIPAAHYAASARVRSPRWETVFLPQRHFRAAIQPVLSHPIPNQTGDPSEA